MIDTGKPEKVLREYNFKQNSYKFFKVEINFFEDIVLEIIYSLRFFFDP